MFMRESACLADKQGGGFPSSCSFYPTRGGYMTQRRLDLALLEDHELNRLAERLKGVLRVVRENDGSKEEADSAQMHLADVLAELELRQIDDANNPW